MIKKPALLIGIVAVVGTVVAGCQNLTGQTDNGANAGVCRPEAANALTGKARLTDDQAKQATGATIVRQIAPGQGVTMDYRRERVTIETDPKTDRIVRAACG